MIGTGGMGTVWAAYNTETNEPVAVKILSENLVQDPDLVGRFLRERSALLGVRHPNLVQMRDLVAEKQRIALVMDLVVGVDAARLLERNGPMPLGDAARLGAEVSGALMAVHSAGIVHRDLKPANILVESSTGSARLVDFGIAWIAGNPRLTAANSVVGTPHYLAPELLIGGEVSPAADVYALAICLYQLLSGVVPFDGEHYGQILQKHLNEAPQPHAAIPPTVWSLIEAMLAKDPSRRPNLQVVANSLAGFGGGAAAGATPAPYALQGPQNPSTPVPGHPGWVPQGPSTPVPGGATGPSTPVPGAPVGPSTPVPGGVPGPSTPVPGQGLPGQQGDMANQGLYTSIPPAPSYGGGDGAAGDPWSQGAPQAVFSSNPPPFSYSPPQKSSRKKPLLIVALVLVVLIGGGLGAWALTSGGGTKPAPIALGSSSSGPSGSSTPSSQTSSATHHWKLCCDELKDTAGAMVASSSGVVLNDTKNGDATFDGKSGTQIVIGGPVIDTEHSFTIAFWLDMHGKTTSTSGRETIVEQRGTQGCAACVEYDPAQQRFVFEMQSSDSSGATTTEVHAISAPKPNDWYRIIASYDAQTQTMTLYIGGVSQGTAKFDASWAPTGSLSFGSGLVHGVATNWYAGNLTDMWIWSQAMTPAQVAKAAS
jgi:serine/threonine-protein kinase